MDKRLKGIERLLLIMDELREKCPWDREQTFESLRSNTIEETYELVDAILDQDLPNIKKELGDLLLHIVFYSKIASEQGAFDIDDVANAISDKLVFRHPHVFGDVVADDAKRVIQNWEDLKLKEKELQNEKKSVLSGVPRSLPSIVKAYRIGQKAASAGFDWEQKQDVWNKVKEEVEELQDGINNADRENIEEEFGDLLFSIVNASRLYGIDPDRALEQSNRKFIRRFTYIEDAAQKQNTTMREMTLQMMEELWNEAKAGEKNIVGAQSEAEIGV